MKVLTVVGARPQFVKAAVVSHVLRKKHTEILVHTGQHFDYNMSELFFEELYIPKPDYNLGISGGTHGQMTGRMIEEIERVLMKEKPDVLLVYGDTNSTLAAALAAAKLGVPICHVEGGVRFYNSKNPEEINRILTDHISSLILVCTQKAFENLKKEGLADRGVWVGDPMYDAFLKYSQVLDCSSIGLTLLDGSIKSVPESFYFMTCHRSENTNEDNELYEILKAMNSLDEKTIYPVHPRNKERVTRLNKKFGFENIMFCEPLGYLENVALERFAKKIVTDSGGVQREAFFANVQCVTVIDFPMWPETLVDNRNQLSAPIKEEIIEKLSREQSIDRKYNPFGEGDAAKRIVSEIERFVLR